MKEKGPFGGHGPQRPDSEERSPTMEELMNRAQKGGVQRMPPGFGPPPKHYLEFDQEIPAEHLDKVFELLDKTQSGEHRNAGRKELFDFMGSIFPDHDFTQGQHEIVFDNPYHLRVKEYELQGPA